MVSERVESKDCGKSEVVGLGNCVMAYMARVPRILGPGEKGSISKMTVRPGGVTVDSLAQLARLGLRVAWLGVLGDDEIGNALLKALKKVHVMTSHVRVLTEGISSYCWVLTDPSGERTGYCDLGDTVRITPEQVTSCFAAPISKASFLLVEVSQFPLDSVLAAATIAKQNGVQVILDFDSAACPGTGGFGTKEQVGEVVRLCDALSGSYIAMEEYTELSDPSAIAGRFLGAGPCLVAVTLGPDGCLIRNERSEIMVPGFKVKVVDTTGAGDAFHAGFAFGYINGWSETRIARFANACGALCCTSPENFGEASLSSIERLMSTGQSGEDQHGCAE